jgi:alpha/beta superfamily hydrolase
MIQTDVSASPAATRVMADGSTERVEFLGAEGERLLSYLHLPASSPRGAVVICPALHGEFMRNYRREVLLARKLAHIGFAVDRVQYRFSGNSDGEDSDLSFDSMREDALFSVERVRELAPGVPVFLAGTRWGAMIAAAAARNHPDAGVVLWEPVLTGSQFFKDAFRNKAFRDLRDGIEQPATSDELEERLRGGEPVDVVAHRIEVELYRSCIDRSLDTEMGDSHRNVLLTQIGPSALRKPFARQVERWQAAGIEVDVEIVRGEENWWLIQERWSDEGTHPLTRALVALSATWLSAHAGEVAS